MVISPILNDFQIPFMGDIANDSKSGTSQDMPSPLVDHDSADSSWIFYQQISPNMLLKNPYGSGIFPLDFHRRLRRAGPGHLPAWRGAAETHRCLVPGEGDTGAPRIRNVDFTKPKWGQLFLLDFKWFKWDFRWFKNWLVVWLPSILFSHSVGLLIIPIDELIFFRGVAQPPTRKYQSLFCVFCCCSIMPGVNSAFPSEPRVQAAVDSRWWYQSIPSDTRCLLLRC